MKGALACAAETCARAHGARCVVPRGAGDRREPDCIECSARAADRTLNWLPNESGFTADYAVVGELGGPTLPVAHSAARRLEVTIGREGMVTHELKTSAGTPNPNLVAARVIEAIRARDEELADGATTSGSALTRTSSARCTVATSTIRHPRRVPARRHKALGPGNTFAGGGGRSSWRCLAHRGESGCAIDLELRSRAGHLPDRPRAPARQCAPRRIRDDVSGPGAASDGCAARRRRRNIHEAGIPIVYHGPMGTGRTGTSRRSACRSSRERTEVYLAMPERLWALTYEELYGGFRWRVPAEVNIGVDARRAPPARCGRDCGHGRTRGHPARHLRRAVRRLEPARERARCGAQGDRRGRPRRDPPAAAGDGSRAHRGLQAGRDRCSAVDALRPGRDDCCGWRDAESRRSSLADRELEGVETIDVDRELPAASRAALRPLRTGGDRGRRAGAGSSYTSGTTGPPRSALLAHRVLLRPPAGVRALARLLSRSRTT